MTKKDRKLIFDKYGGRCGYSGTVLEHDWQVEHIVPVVRDLFTGKMMFPKEHNLYNMIPVQKLINHYKHSVSLEDFRTWLLGGLHERLARLPKNPKTDKSKKRKEYILNVAGYFGITPDNPFSQIFYFETAPNPTTVKSKTKDNGTRKRSNPIRHYRNVQKVYR